MSIKKKESSQGQTSKANVRPIKKIQTAEGWKRMEQGKRMNQKQHQV